MPKTGHRPRGAKGVTFALAACALVLLAANALAGGGFDRGFSGDGKRITDLGGSEDLSAVETIGNRRIVVGGYTDLFGDDDFAITRYRRNGGRDGSFGANGGLDGAFAGDEIKSFTIDPGAQSEGARDLAVQRDGRIVAVGFTFDGSSGDQAIVRLRP